jgi:hypothetical protein
MTIKRLTATSWGDFNTHLSHVYARPLHEVGFSGEPKKRKGL